MYIDSVFMSVVFNRVLGVCKSSSRDKHSKTLCLPVVCPMNNRLACLTGMPGMFSLFMDKWEGMGVFLTLFTFTITSFVV